MPGLGQEQAWRYAEDLQQLHGGPVPLIFYTNGYDTYFWDSELYPPEKVSGFPTRDDLSWMRQRQETRRPLSEALVNAAIAGRDYQIGHVDRSDLISPPFTQIHPSGILGIFQPDLTDEVLALVSHLDDRAV